MELQIYTDGGSLNNPGEAATAFVLYLDNKLFLTFSKRIGKQTNNAAEYLALLHALGWLKENRLKYKISKANVFSDSNLMVNQVNGFFKVKNSAIREFILKIRILEQEINLPISYSYIPREKNRLADSLVKKELIPVF